MQRANRILVSLVFLFLLVGCREEIAVPKPRGLLRLDYPEARYEAYRSPGSCGFGFLRNTRAELRSTGGCNLEIVYGGMKGTIFLTYKPVKGNLEALLKDAQKLSYEHMSKAEQITEQPFVNPENRVYGMFYEVTGDAASQSQFYVTDSTRHFLVGSLYFESLPNYDSILPAAEYVRQDIRVLIESIDW